jgi:hypothetical protein
MGRACCTYGSDDKYIHKFGGKPEIRATNFLDIIHCLSLIKNMTFLDQDLSPSSGKTYSVGPNRQNQSRDRNQ